MFIRLHGIYVTTCQHKPIVAPGQDFQGAEATAVKTLEETWPFSATVWDLRKECWGRRDVVTRYTSSHTTAPVNQKSAPYMTLYSASHTRFQPRGFSLLPTQSTSQHVTYPFRAPSLHYVNNKTAPLTSLDAC